jgi:hypothetical protein
MPAVFVATLICSDVDCAEELEAWGTLEELDALACDCGCVYVVVGIAEAHEVSLPRARAHA